MLNIKFFFPSINCTAWCLETLRLYGMTDAVMREKAVEACKGKRAVLIPAEWFQEHCNDDILLLLEFVGTQNNNLTGKEEKVFCFIKKLYSVMNLTYNSCEFTIPGV